MLVREQVTTFNRAEQVHPFTRFAGKLAAFGVNPGDVADAESSVMTTVIWPDVGMNGA
jgi:hypothetical protein